MCYANQGPLFKSFNMALMISMETVPPVISSHLRLPSPDIYWRVSKGVGQIRSSSEPKFGRALDLSVSILARYLDILD